MKIAPVSADLLVKLALGAGAVLAVIYLGKKAANSVTSAVDAAGQAVVHPFPAFDAWMQGKWDSLTGSNTQPTPPTTTPLPIEFGVNDPNAGW